MHNRNQYYLRHAATLDDMTDCIIARMKRTLEYMAETIAFLRETAHSYRLFSEESRKVNQLSYLTKPSEAATKSRYQWSGRAAEGMKQVFLSQTDYNSRMRGEEYFLSANCIDALMKRAKVYEEKYRSNGKWAMAFKAKFCSF